MYGRYFRACVVQDINYVIKIVRFAGERAASMPTESSLETAGRAVPSFDVATSMFIWLTFSCNGRRASSYTLLTTRFKMRRRTATHWCAIWSICWSVFFRVIVARESNLDHPPEPRPQRQLIVYATTCAARAVFEIFQYRLKRIRLGLDIRLVSLLSPFPPVPSRFASRF